MYRDRIIETKKAKGISTKTMSERSVLHLPEETISRFLNGKINDPHVSTLLDTGATVGLAPYELFMDASTAAEFRLFLESKVTNIDNSAELEVLRIQTAEQAHKIELLEEKLRAKEELLSVYKHFVNIKPVE